MGLRIPKTGNDSMLGRFRNRKETSNAQHKMFLSPLSFRKFQGFQKLCVSNWGQTINIFLSQFQSQVGCPLVVIRWFAETVASNYDAQIWQKKRERALSMWGWWEFDRDLKFTVSQLRSHVRILPALGPGQGGRPRWAVRPGSGLELH